MSDTSELGGIGDGHTATSQQVEEELRTSDEIRSSYVSGLTFTNRPVRYSVVEGQAIFEGDILLGTVEEMEQIRQSVEGPPPEGAARGIVIPGAGFRWPNRTINFTVDNALPNTQRVTDAIQQWEDNTNVRFRQRTNEANFVTFRPSTGCSSSVGMRGGQQFINLAGGCTTGSTIHEIGHCAGLWHEQSREDRNLFVTIDFTNIQPANLHNFDQHITDGDDIAPYDYDSIMHYSSTAFAIDSSKPTIIAPQPIGQRNGLSEFDIRSINAIYPLKTVLGDQSTNGPALTQRASELLLGWTGVGNLRLNCMRSGDGSAFSGKVTLNDTSQSALALSVFRGRYVVAWRGVGNNQLNVMQSVDGQTWTDKVTLNETTESSPALAVFGDLLCIAWRGVGNNQLNVMLSTNGRNWLAKRTMTDTTTSGPALAVVNSRLLLAWRGVANNLLNAMRSFNGSTFFGKVTLPETTLSKPFLHVDDEIAYLCWQGVGNGFLNLLPSLDGLDWRGKITSGETCIDGPVLGTVGDHLVWGWTGTDQAHSLNTGLI
jgi:hypothetical protein